MREIKFRAWNPDSFNPKGQEYKMIYSKNNLVYFFHSLNYYTGYETHLMQFTGLKDKNGKGKEIYHKDIFGSRNGDVVVEWVNDGWSVCWDDGCLQSLMEFLSENPNYPVIGNIYENSELTQS